MSFDAFPEVSFEELLSQPLRNGLTRPKRVRGQGVRMVNMGELFGNRRIGDISMERVPLNAKNPDRDLLAEQDLLFARQSIVADGAGKVAIFTGASEPITFESHLIRARIDQTKADPEWLFYFFESPLGRSRVQAMVHQVAAAGIRGSDLVRVQVPCPGVEEQRRTTKALRALDDKIESNRRIAATLGEIAATLFNAHFVDFVDHDDLVESEVGPIPRGWNVMPVGEAVKVVGGSTPSTKESRYWEEGTHCWATPKDLSGLTSPVLLDTSRHITDAGVETISSKLLPERTVLLSSRAPVGYTAISMTPVAVNQGFIAIPPNDGPSSEYVLFWLRENMDEIRAHAGGTTFAEISKRAFRPLPMLMPPPDEIDAFDQSARPMIDQIASLDRQRRHLAALRDALLPKLISGEVRVPADAFGDAEAA